MTLNINHSDLTEHLIFHAIEKNQDSMGGIQESLTEIGRFFAKVEPVLANEGRHLYAGHIEMRVAFKVWIRWTKNLPKKVAIVWNQDTFSPITPFINIEKSWIYFIMEPSL